MADLFARIILGHLAGDYLLQSKSMALQKASGGARGFWWCTLHCLIYAVVVCLFLWTANPLIGALVFLSHWPIDRWSLASHWLKMIKGRDFIAAHLSQEKFKEVDLVFSCLVYVVVDNTLHLILLWLITKLI